MRVMIVWMNTQLKLYAKKQAIMEWEGTNYEMTST